MPWELETRGGARKAGTKTACAVSVAGVEPDAFARGIGRCKQLADGIEEGFELAVVFAFEGMNFAGEFLDGKSHLTKADKGVNDFHAHADRRRTVEDGSRHESAMLGEHVGSKPDVALGCGHIL